MAIDRKKRQDMTRKKNKIGRTLISPGLFWLILSGQNRQDGCVSHIVMDESIPRLPTELFGRDEI